MYCQRAGAANVTSSALVGPASIETSVGRASWTARCRSGGARGGAASPTIHSWSIGSVFVITNVTGRPAGTRDRGRLVVRVVDRDRDHDRVVRPWPTASGDDRRAEDGDREAQPERGDRAIQSRIGATRSLRRSRRPAGSRVITARSPTTPTDRARRRPSSRRAEVEPRRDARTVGATGPRPASRARRRPRDGRAGARRRRSRGRSRAGPPSPSTATFVSHADGRDPVHARGRSGGRSRRLSSRPAL